MTLLEAHPLAAMAKVKFALAIFNGVETPTPKILFEGEVAPTNKTMSSNLGDLREFHNKKREKSQQSHCNYEQLINACYPIAAVLRLL